MTKKIISDNLSYLLKIEKLIKGAKVDELEGKFVFKILKTMIVKSCAGVKSIKYYRDLSGDDMNLKIIDKEGQVFDVVLSKSYVQWLHQEKLDTLQIFVELTDLVMYQIGKR